MGLPWQEYWSRFPCPPPADLPNPGIETHVFWVSSALQADSLPSEPPGKPKKQLMGLKPWIWVSVSWSAKWRLSPSLHHVPLTPTLLQPLLHILGCPMIPVTALLRKGNGDSPGGPGVKNPPPNVGDSGSSLVGELRFHTPWSNWAQVPQLVSLNAVEFVHLNERRPCVP